MEKWKLYNIEQKGTSSEAKSLFIIDNGFNRTLYISGLYNDGNNRACYWKYENIYDLPRNNGAVNSVANSIFINNKDVFIAGDDGNDEGYWINNSFISLPNSTDSASLFLPPFSIFISDANVHVAGIYASGPSAGYWKNGNSENIDAIVNSDTTCIYVYSNDVYISGGYPGPNTACYWKNGNRVNLDNGYSFGIFVARSKYVSH